MAPEGSKTFESMDGSALVELQDERRAEGAAAADRSARPLDVDPVDAGRHVAREPPCRPSAPSEKHSVTAPEVSPTFPR
jgi:hypothetical protein